MCLGHVDWAIVARCAVFSEYFTDTLVYVSVDRKKEKETTKSRKDLENINWLSILPY